VPVNALRTPIAAAMVLIASAAQATAAFDIIVPDDQATLAAALSAVHDGGTIGIRAGAYDIGDLVLENWTKSVTITAAERELPELLGSLRMASSAACEIRLERLVFRGVQGQVSLALFGPNTPAAGRQLLAEVRQCEFLGPGLSGVVAGGVVISNAIATVADCAFADCSTNNAGSGLEFINSTSLVERCVFERNRGGFYGALSNYRCCGWSSAVAEVRDCVFIANTATLNGGGFFGYGGTSATISTSYFCSNTPSHVGGNWTDGGSNIFSASADDCLIPEPCPADLNNDGVVNGADISIMLGFWGLNGEPVDADINGDGLVDGADLAMLLSSWGKCP